MATTKRTVYVMQYGCFIRGLVEGEQEVLRTDDKFAPTDREIERLGIQIMATEETVEIDLDKEKRDVVAAKEKSLLKSATDTEAMKQRIRTGE